MVEAIVSSTIAVLRDLLIKEAFFLSGVRKQVQEIQTELERMQCFLKDAEWRSYEDERVRYWIKSVRKLAYRIEDVLETYAIKVESRKGKGIKKTLRRCVGLLDEGVNHHRLGLEIGNIKNQIASLTTSLQSYGINLENAGESSNAARKNLLRETFAHEMEEHFVGMEDDVHKLVSLMTDGDKDAGIISIFGMGGSGKTTLAKQVFNHKDVQNHFESFAWVTLSQQFEPDNLLQEILRQLRKDKDDIKRMEYTELVQELFEAQKQKKCLVVLDDIWRAEHWKIFSHAFPNTSKVLLTTRIQGVAEIGIPHKLNLFSEEEGWQLLKKKALIGKNGRDSNLQAKQEKLGKEMVRKCGYLPLAVSVIGGVLSKKETLQEWEMVNKDIDSYLSLGEGVEDNHQVMQILTLSYEDLPYQLKPCLLYLAYYPEDTVINVRNLYWMWMAEGLILSKDRKCNESLVEVAERYLTVLASRSLVQVQLNEEIRSISKSCRLHDLIHDLCIRKCKEEDFLKVMDCRGSKQPIHDLDSLGGNAYRLVIYASVAHDIYNKILREANEGTRACSLRCPRSYPLIAGGVSKNLTNLRFLRVVAFESLDFSNLKVLDEVIEKLIQLRFLSFEKCKLDEVPSSVAKLTYLQTFHLSCASLYAVKIPNVFWKLKRLVHFVLCGRTRFRSSKKLDFLSGVETLICFSPYSASIKVLSKLTNLRVFESDVDDNESLSLIINCIESSWSNIRGGTLRLHPNCDFIGTIDGSILLQKLFLCRTLQHLEIWHIRIRELPRYESGMLDLSDLVELKLYGNYIEEDPMPTLEKLPKLKRLNLLYGSFEGEELICSSTGFPKLKALQLVGFRNLKKWRIDDEAMPNLSIIRIGYCHKLEMIPNGMKFLKALRKLVSSGMPKEFNDRIQIVNGEEGADFHKVRHVPSIYIY